ncbi:hypothetical protein ACIRYZ_31145 [Kitasatospora sp. NPDC101155]|uniref:hypothetical protein n=1 Tax=Kitasatospora sp. NPDC101155 TaxID=3364097 RepID=UPI00382F8299
MAANGWTDDLPDRMRGTGDPLGDAAIAEIYALGQQEQVRQMLLGFGRNSGAAPAGLPPKLQQYFEESAILPPWADQAQMARGRLNGHPSTRPRRPPATAFAPGP